MSPTMIAVLAGSVGALVFGGTAGYAGYKYRDNQCRADSAETRAAVSDALALLAARYAAADAELARVRGERDRALDARVKENVDETKRLPDPDRSPGWTGGERRLLVKTFCDSFPDATGCVPDQVR